jgi:uncharacterized membrane protein YfcA
MPPLLVMLGLSLLTAAVGTLGGIGGAIMLVPVLVLIGVEPQIAAPLGLLSVGAASLAAAPAQLADGVVHHRLGVTLEITASAGAIAGALFADAIPESVLARLLAVVAIVAAVIGARRKSLRNPPRAEFALENPGEWPGTLGGTYRLGDDVVPYTASNVPQGLTGMVGAGFISGMAGIGGGFIKTPIMSELMHVPVKVAAATSTFTVGITSATALVVFAGQGRIDYRAGAAVVVGGLLGGTAGGALQRRLHPRHVRIAVSVILVVIGLVLLVRG